MGIAHLARALGESSYPQGNDYHESAILHKNNNI